MKIYSLCIIHLFWFPTFYHLSLCYVELGIAYDNTNSKDREFSSFFFLSIFCEITGYSELIHLENIRTAINFSCLLIALQSFQTCTLVKLTSVAFTASWAHAAIFRPRLLMYDALLLFLFVNFFRCQHSLTRVYFLVKKKGCNISEVRLSLYKNNIFCFFTIKR